MKRAHQEEDYSIYKSSSASFRGPARNAALAMAEFWGAIADSAVGVVSAATDTLVEVGSRSTRDRSFGEVGAKSNASHAAAYAAASRYFEEMAQIARDAEATENAKVDQTRIDYELLARAIVSEMGRVKPAKASDPG